MKRCNAGHYARAAYLLGWISTCGVAGLAGMRLHAGASEQVEVSHVH